MFKFKKKTEKNYTPAVFAVGSEYQIMVPAENDSLMWVKIGGKTYYDDSNGILRSLTKIHRMTVPASELDKEGKYTVCERVIRKRYPYFPVIDDVVEKDYSWKP